jgi:hypothetical protein
MIGKGAEDINIRMPEDAGDMGNYVPTFNAYLTAIVRDSEGKIIKVHRQKSHSPTANFIGLFLPISFFSTNNTSFTITKATGGTCTYNPALSNTAYDIPYPSTDVNYPVYIVMIQVGSGQQSDPFSAYSLAAPIANGSGGGQLVYQPVVLPSQIVLNGNTAYFYITQTYNNLSGTTITITEVGILLNLTLAIYNTTGSNKCGNILVWYDALSSAISVPNGGSVTIYYTFMVNP